MKQETTKQATLSVAFDLAQPAAACALLAARTGLSKTKIKDAMNKGAAWVRKKGKMQRLRKATALLRKGDHVELHYDEKLLSLAPPEAKLISDLGHYSVWSKPAGLMTQGTMFGDHCSLLRQAELYFRMQRPVFPVHRLDREADGLMLIAHSRDAAAKLSALFRNKQITKEYRIEVRGNLGEEGRKGTIDQPLEGKDAVTDYEVICHGPEQTTTVVSAFIRTGRFHQIRRHFAMTGFPVMGDPRYGKGNKNRAGMKLTAVSLKFICPFTKKDEQFTVLSQK
jgi:tRNA pseudouridine32 synthase/23S rRNA pseudouridine746 synthase